MLLCALKKSLDVYRCFNNVYIFSPRYPGSALGFKCVIFFPDELSFVAVFKMTVFILQLLQSVGFVNVSGQKIDILGCI